MDESESYGFRLDNLTRARAPERIDPGLFRDPTIRLMLAVLDDAISCYLKYARATRRRGQRIFRETREWFFSENVDWLFDFENICEVIGVNPHYVRRGLLRSGNTQGLDDKVDRQAASGLRGSSTQPIPQAGNRSSAIHHDYQPLGNRVARATSPSPVFAQGAR